MTIGHFCSRETDNVA